MINNLIILFAKLNAVVWILLSLFAIWLAQANAYEEKNDETRSEFVKFIRKVNNLHLISSILLIITIVMLK